VISRHLHVHVHDGRAVAIEQDGQERAASGAAGPVLLALAREHADACIGWSDRRAGDLLSDPATWPALLDRPHHIRSVGLLHAEDPWLATVGAADFDSALQAPPPSDRPFGSWLLSPLGGVAAASALRAAGAPPADLPFPAWILALGHRAYLAGALLWSDPRLVAPDARDQRRSVHTGAGIAAVVRHAFGRRFLLPWAAAQPTPARAAAALVESARAAARPDRTRPPGTVPWPEPPRDAHPLPAIDVVIPTLGRRALLLDTLDDLGRQTVPPASVVVVEQTGGRPAGVPLAGDRWPFAFEHVVIEQLGAGNARNVGITRGTSPWVLLLDDDVRFAPDMVERLFRRLTESGAGAITARLELVAEDDGDPHDPGVRPDGPVLHMWQGFGSGCALLRRELLDEVGGFDRRIDGGFGEDTELGVRLRRAGALVVLTADPHIGHLKASTGGMRAPFPHPWRADPDRPRPSPTVLLARRTFETPSMAAGYRLHWWLDGLRSDGSSFRPRQRLRQWRSAARWADRLEQREGAEQAHRLDAGTP
jgi:hypothetical protein